MSPGFKSLDFSNKSNVDRRIDEYYNLPRKLERAESRKPIGSKHNKRNEISGIFNKTWSYFDSGEYMK